MSEEKEVTVTEEKNEDAGSSGGKHIELTITDETAVKEKLG
jgi:hypothetical protein